MYAFIFLIFSALVLMCGETFAQTPIYAIYGVEMIGPNGAIKTLNVGILPSDSNSDCQRHIDAFTRGNNRADPTGRSRLLPSSCVFTVPENLQPLIREQPLADAYVLKQSGNWAPIYTAWYGLPMNEPVGMCNRLIDGIRKGLGTNQVDVRCKIPAMAQSKIK